MSVLGEIADPSNAGVKGAKGGKGKSVEQTYQKLTQHQHILQRPDTYVGSIESDTQEMWVMDADEGRMKKRKLEYTPGLYKIFDEILVNAADNKQRDASMDAIKIDIDRETGRISVWNSGKGIPVVVHKEHGIYVPELVFSARARPAPAPPWPDLQRTRGTPAHTRPTRARARGASQATCSRAATSTTTRRR